MFEFGEITLAVLIRADRQMMPRDFILRTEGGVVSGFQVITRYALSLREA